jgi:hypothetical protein
MDAVGAKNSAGRRTVNVQFGGRGQKIGARIERPGIVEQVKQAMAGKADMPEPRRWQGGGGGYSGGGGYGGDDEGEDIEDYDFGGSSGLDDETIEMDWGDYDYDIIDPGDDGDFYFDD